MKAAGKRAQRAVAAAYAAEADARPAPATPVCPRPQLLWVEDTADWVVLGIRAVEGRNPTSPLVRGGARRVPRALEQVADAFDRRRSRLITLRPVTDDMPALLDGWEEVRRTSPDWPPPRRGRCSRAGCRECPGRTGSSTSTPATTTSSSTPRRAPCSATGTGPASARCGSTWSTCWSRRTATASTPSRAGRAPAHRRRADRAHRRRGLRPHRVHGRPGDRPVPPSSPYLRVHARWWSAAGWAWLSHRRGWA